MPFRVAILLQTVVCWCVLLSPLHSVVICCILLSAAIIVLTMHSRSGLAEARTRLAALGEKKPPTTAGQLRELWPEIETALARRHPLKAICECLEAGGVNVNPRTLAAYIARMRKNSGQSVSMKGKPQVPIAERESPANVECEKISDGKQRSEQSLDPLANIRHSEAKRPVFDYRPELADPKKLI
jgi:hypothetical protein